MARSVSGSRGRPGRRVGAGAAALLLAALVASCDEDDPVRPLLPDVAGIWMQVGGQYLLDPDVAAEAAGVALVLEIDDDSGGSLHRRALASGVVTCISIIYGLPAADQMLASLGRGTTLYGVARPHADSLVLTDAAGHLTVFARIAAPPDSMLCSSLPIVRRHDLSLDCDGRTGLAFDGTFLWFTGITAHDLIPVEPASGAVAAPRRIDVADASVVESAQGADLWRTCGCDPYDPGFGKVFRITPEETIAEKVSSRAFGTWDTPRCVAYDPGAGSLWIHGFGRHGPFTLLEIDAEADPDELLRSFSLGFAVDAMCWRGSELLALIGNRVVRIDGSTFRVLRTYDPPADLELSGIAVAGAQVFALATPWASSQAIILELGL